MSGLGYAQFAPLLAGRAGLDEVVHEIKRATRRFVRHQANWFRSDDPRIHWIESARSPVSQALALALGFLDLLGSGLQEM
jgi:tRNA dimethylallyltransferase